MIFGDSIRSDFDNPLATSWRAIMRALTRAGHEVVFVEPRRSESLARLLRHRGSAPLRQFAEHYPDIQYRTMDLPRGRELSIWLARELALVDAVIVLENAASEIRDQIAAYDEPRLLRVIQSATGYAIVGSPENLELVPAIDVFNGETPGAVPTGPARLAILAWDAEQSSLASQVWHAAVETDWSAIRLSLGSLALDGWEAITDLDLSDRLREVDFALVISTIHPTGPAALVRSLLPWSHGVPSLTVETRSGDVSGSLPGPFVSLANLAAGIDQLAGAQWPDLVPWSAEAKAADLIAGIDRSRASLRADRT